MRTTFPSIFVSLAFGAALVGCPDNTPPAGDDAGLDAAAHHGEDAPGGGGPSCEMIIAACHDVDPGSGPIHDCHETAHDAASTEALCASMLTDCLAMCTAVDAGPPSDHDAGAHMH